MQCLFLIILFFYIITHLWEVFLLRFKTISLVLAVIFIFGIFPNQSYAAYAPPTEYGAPRNLGVIFNAEDLVNKPERWYFNVGFSTSPEIRSLFEAYADRTFQNAGYNSLNVTVLLDYKVDDDTWRSAKPNYYDWVPNNYTYFDANTGNWTGNFVVDPTDLIEKFTTRQFEGGQAYFDSHTISFRLRFWVEFWGGDPERRFSYFSTWSDAVNYNNSQTVYDAESLLNYEPKILSAILKKDIGDAIYIEYITDRINNNTQLLNNISAGNVNTDVWFMIEGGDWINVGQFKYLREKFTIDVSQYFTGTELTGNEKFETKFRYSFDNANYPVANKTGIVYSPYSGIISNGIPIYKNASYWAVAELDEAQLNGFITNRILNNISGRATREEFAEIIVKMFEKSTGAIIEIGEGSYTDTNNTEILKALSAGLMNGVGRGRFAPNAYLTREQMAVTIFRAIKILKPNDDFSITGIPKFIDDNRIEKWAKEGVYYCAKVGIVKGVGRNKYSPDAYATREMAVLVCQRGYEYQLPV